MTCAISCSSVPTRQQYTINTSVSLNQPAILSIIPSIGSLHVSLNAQETAFKDFRGFFADVYCKLIPRWQLAKRPKPWMISLYILELVYGGAFIWDAVKINLVFVKTLNTEHCRTFWKTTYLQCILLHSNF